MSKKFILLIMILGIVFFIYAEFPGSCLHFEQGDYVTGTGIESPLSNVSIEAWIKHDDEFGGNQRYVTLKNETAVLRAENTNLKFYVKQINNSIAAVSVPNVLVPNEWMHVAGTYNGSILNLYLNGQLIGSNVAITGGLAVTTGSFDFSSGSESLKGCIDEVKVWNTVRTISEIRSNRFIELTGSEPGLIAYWSLNTISGTEFSDQTGNTIGHFVNMDTNAIIDSTVPVISSEPGEAIYFDGTDDYLQMQTRIGLPVYNSGIGNAYSISMWIKGEPGQSWKTIYAEQNPSVLSQGFKMTTYPNSSKIFIDIRPDHDSFWLMMGSTSAVLDNTWHQITWVDDNGNATLYVDGIQDASDFSYTPGTLSLTEANFGARNNYEGNMGSFFSGRLDEVSFWNTALNIDQVNLIKHSTLNGNEAGLVAYYQFNESEGDIVYDFASRNNGILNNMTFANRVQSDILIGPIFSGDITDNTVWDYERLYVVSDVNISNNATLTITPGTTVYFDPACKLSVQYGSIQAVGTSGNPIVLTGQEANGWHGINLTNVTGTSDSTRFRYCKFYNGTTNGEYQTNDNENNGGAVSIHNFDKV
ncbi:MAG: LamG domain-containing protein, partial [Candidatus Cloacimonetes bacterium]|nr:LamG domain-containing protein [Candidatus Cloacimonadota bacterium]